MQNLLEANWQTLVSTSLSESLPGEDDKSSFDFGILKQEDGGDRLQFVANSLWRITN